MHEELPVYGTNLDHEGGNEDAFTHGYCVADRKLERGQSVDISVPIYFR